MQQDQVHVAADLERVKPRDDMDGDDRSDLAAALLLERLVREVYTDRAPGSVTQLQWAILRAISRAGDGGCTQNWIGRFVGVTAAPVSRAIRALERHQAVTTRRDDDDGRQTIVELTTIGHDLLKSDPLLAITGRLSRLDDSDKVAFRRALQHLSFDPVEHG